jgi:hypothetical protein
MQKEAPSCTRLQAAQAFADTRELKGRHIVQNQDVIAIATPSPSHHRVRA